MSVKKGKRTVAALMIASIFLMGMSFCKPWVFCKQTNCFIVATKQPMPLADKDFLTFKDLP